MSWQEYRKGDTFFNKTEMKNSSEEKILRITIDNKPKIKSHVKTYVSKLSKRYGFCHF